MREGRFIFRIGLIALFSAVLTGVCVRALWTISSSGGAVTSRTAVSARVEEAPRGDILDRNGNTLAGSEEIYSVRIEPEVWRKGDTEAKLARLRGILADCGVTLGEIPADKVVARGIPRQTAETIEKDRLLLSGAEVFTEFRREYEGLASHAVGRAGQISRDEYERLKGKGYKLNDTLGKDGIELAYENYLRGEDGKTSVELDEAGRVIGVLDETPMVPGDHLVLTIDAELQRVLEGLLAHTIDKLGTNAGGSAVAMKVKTGEILAMASYPDFDAAHFSRDYAGLSADPRSPLFNRAISGLYAPGSVFKMLTAVAGLESGAITTETKILDEGVYRAYESSGYAPSCWLYRKNGETHGLQDVIGAIKNSCNYFFYETGIRTGISQISKYARLFGLGEKTGIELPGESAGNLASPLSRAEKGGTWYDGDTLGASIGQSDHLFTPLQLVDYIAALTNGGVRYKPHIVKQILDGSDGSVIYETVPEISSIIPMSRENIAAVLEGMREVTEDGTASAAFKDYPIEVGGKTGSVQVSSQEADNGLFAAFAPFDDPEVAIVIVAEEAGTGGSLGGIARGFFDACFGLGGSEGNISSENRPLP